jgi:hypothetical protein
LNLLVKGVDVDELDELRDVLVARWCDRVDAAPSAQWVGAVNEGPGLVRYIALHFLKVDQSPPLGWRGHRTSYSRDYLVRPASIMREEAKSSLRLKRLLWRGVPAELAELELELRAAHVWSLRHVKPHTFVPSAQPATRQRTGALPMRESTRGDSRQSG